jgi:hypothetical protein
LVEGDEFIGGFNAAIAGAGIGNEVIFNHQKIAEKIGAQTFDGRRDHSVEGRRSVIRCGAAEGLAGHGVVAEDSNKWTGSPPGCRPKGTRIFDDLHILQTGLLEDVAVSGFGHSGKDVSSAAHGYVDEGGIEKLLGNGGLVGGFGDMRVKGGDARGGESVGGDDSDGAPFALCRIDQVIEAFALLVQAELAGEAGGSGSEKREERGIIPSLVGETDRIDHGEVTFAFEPLEICFGGAELSEPEKIRAESWGDDKNDAVGAGLNVASKVTEADQSKKARD